MYKIILSSIVVSLLLTNFLFSVNAKEIDLEDLISIDINNINSRAEEFTSKEQQAKDKAIEDILGPEDNFPFLPDNHRDSGTGKFNAF